MICSSSATIPTMLLLLAASLPAADTGTHPYALIPGPARLYLVETKQEVAWDSAGDHLTFTSSLATSQAWKCTGVTDGVATVQATILRVIARHEGPGSQHAFDSGLRDSPDAPVAAESDPLLGHLKGLDGVTLTFAINLATGSTAVTGGATIAANIAKRAPNLVDPQAPSPLAAQAVILYSDANLSRTWSQLLARPAVEPQHVPLGDPLTGTLLRTWKGDAYTLAGEVTGTAVLAREPATVTAAVSNVSGSGTTALGPDGWPGTASGTLSFTLTIDAVTQPVVQQHVVSWQLARLTPGATGAQRATGGATGDAGSR